MAKPPSHKKHKTINQCDSSECTYPRNYHEKLTNSIVSDIRRDKKFQNLSSIAINESSFILSEMEEAVLRSSSPIPITTKLLKKLLKQKHQLSNKAPSPTIPINQFLINYDNCPIIVNKKPLRSIEYFQELAIRYLKPVTPPSPGPVIIKQESNKVMTPAPPIIIRQKPAIPLTPEPLIMRTAPPKAPHQIGRKVITISGKKLPPPPRKVVVERLPPLPPKPKSAIVERWLPYKETKRKVVYNKIRQPSPIFMKPRNIIVQWEPPCIKLRKDYKHLGIIRANPNEYVNRFRSTLKESKNLPEFVLEIKPPKGIVLAANCKQSNVPKLEGDLIGLKYIDLEKEGLNEYKEYLNKNTINDLNSLYKNEPVHLNDLNKDSKREESQNMSELNDNEVANFSMEIQNETIFTSVSSFMDIANKNLCNLYTKGNNKCDLKRTDYYTNRNPYSHSGIDNDLKIKNRSIFSSLFPQGTQSVDVINENQKMEDVENKISHHQSLGNTFSFQKSELSSTSSILTTVTESHSVINMNKSHAESALNSKFVNSLVKNDLDNLNQFNSTMGSSQFNLGSIPKEHLKTKS